MIYILQLYFMVSGDVTQVRTYNSASACLEAKKVIDRDTLESQNRTIFFCEVRGKE